MLLRVVPCCSVGVRGKRVGEGVERLPYPRISSAASARGQPGTCTAATSAPPSCAHLAMALRSRGPRAEAHFIHARRMPHLAMLASKCCTLLTVAPCFLGSAGLSRRQQYLRVCLLRPPRHRALRLRRSRRRRLRFRRPRRRWHRRHQCRRLRSPPRLRGLPSVPPPSLRRRRSHPSRSTRTSMPADNAEVSPAAAGRPLALALAAGRPMLLAIRPTAAAASPCFPLSAFPSLPSPWPNASGPQPRATPAISAKTS